MKKFILSAIAFIASATFVNAQSTTYVNGYTRTNGTYVQPHVRTSANTTILDNWSTRPNVNPYTGTVGTVNPYSTSSTSTYTLPTYTAPTYSYPSYSMPTYSYPSYSTSTYRRR
jgi:hypothetical protein